MHLYIFLSVVVICITIIICFIIRNYTDINDYYKYKSAYYELQKLKEEHNNKIIEYNIKINDICSRIDKLKIFDSDYIKNNNSLINLIYSINAILMIDAENTEIIDKIQNKLRNFHFLNYE